MVLAKVLQKSLMQKWCHYISTRQQLPLAFCKRHLIKATIMLLCGKCKYSLWLPVSAAGMRLELP